jgi:hypothetical protein
LTLVLHVSPPWHVLPPQQIWLAPPHWQVPDAHVRFGPHCVPLLQQGVPTVPHAWHVVPTHCIPAPHAVAQPASAEPLEVPLEAPLEVPLDVPLDVPLEVPLDAPLEAASAAESAPLDPPLDEELLDELELDVELVVASGSTTAASLAPAGGGAMSVAVPFAPIMISFGSAQ